MKGKIKEWAGLDFGEVGAIKDEILEEINLIDKEEEIGQLDVAKISRRLSLKDEYLQK